MSNARFFKADGKQINFRLITYPVEGGGIAQLEGCCPTNLKVCVLNLGTYSKGLNLDTRVNLNVFVVLAWHVKVSLHP
jgi:hypothetical protein